MPEMNPLWIDERAWSRASLLDSGRHFEGLQRSEESNARIDGPRIPIDQHGTWLATRIGGLFFLFSRRRSRSRCGAAEPGKGEKGGQFTHFAGSDPLSGATRGTDEALDTHESGSAGRFASIDRIRPRQ